MEDCKLLNSVIDNVPDLKDLWQTAQHGICCIFCVCCSMI